MFKLRSSFIGYPESASLKYFSGSSDSELKYKNSLMSQDPSWEYATKQIEYKRNNFGHRCKNLEDLDLSNYILVAGCSVTEGIGITEDSRYSNVLANLLNCDLYNLAIGGTGNDVIFYNLHTWFSTVKQKPKFVIVQWTDNSRFFTIDKDEKVYCFGSWDEEHRDFVVSANNNNYYTTRTIYYKKMVRQMVEVPVIEIPWITKGPDDIEKTDRANYEFQIRHDYKTDLARDLIHFGTKSNEIIGTALYMYIINSNIPVVMKT